MRTVLALLLLVALCASAHHKRHIHLQGVVIDPLDEDAPVLAARADGASAEYLVQLQPPVSAATISLVEKECSLRFVNDVRIPYHSFLAVATPEQVARLEAHPLVLFVTNFIAAYKYPASLATWQTTALAGTKSAELIVVLHSTTTAAAAEQLIKSWVAPVKKELGVEMRVLRAVRPDRVHVKVPTAKFFALVQWLAGRVGTLWIEPAVEHRSFANKATGIVESGVAGRANILEAAGINGAGSVVSLADTGLDWQSCFFNMTAAPTPTFNPSDKIVSYTVDGGDQVDATGHGTAMAALIAGDPDVSQTAYRGLAPKARIAFTDISVGTGGTYTGPADIYQYIQSARNLSNVIVGAFGTTAPVTWYTTRDQDVDNILYQLRGSLTLVFAAGNYGQTVGGANVPGVQLASPATAKNVISVGASQNDLASVISAAAANATLSANINADNSQYGADVLAPFSSKGPAFDGRLKPDVVAPGMGVYTASTDACGVAPVEGTSFAAALVGAAAVLVRQYLRLGFKGSGTPQTSDVITPSAALIKATIINSGVPLSGYSAAAGKFVSTQEQIPHPAYGFGRVQLDNVLFVDSVPQFGALSLFQDSSAAGVTQGETQRYCFDVTGAERDLKVTLVWTDPKGSIVAGFVLTNNIDLLVMDPAGRTYYANGLDTFDSINNVEQVTVSNPKSGSWVALIHGLHIDSAVTPSGQPWAIVVSGNVSTPASGCPTRCPHACNGLGTCSQGVCACNTGRFGVDCSLTACPNNCSAVDGSLNGLCNPITATCECAPQFGGADCRSPANETTVTVVRRNKGLSNGAVAGIAVGTFFAGAILCGAIGFVVAIQYLIWKRKNHKKLIEEGKGGKGGGL